MSDIVFTPGIYYNVTEQDYRAAPGLSSTELRQFIKLPALYKAHRDGLIKPKESPALNFGTAYHAFVLEPEKLHHNFAVAQKFDRRTKQGKADAEAFEADNFGKMIIDADDYAQLVAMKSEWDKAGLNRFICDGAREVALFWVDQVSGVLCKARLDYWERGKYAIDLKTTSKDASGDEFARSVANFGYHIQQAHYQAGVEALTGSADRFVFSVQQTEEPYFAVLHELSETYQKIANAERENALYRLKCCIELNEWPGYTSQVIEPPTWLSNQYEGLK